MKKSTFVILCFEAAVLSFSFAATAAIVPSVAKTFVLSQFMAGKIVWLYMLPYGIAALLYGPLVRVFDARRVELVCLFLFSLANFLAGLAANISMLFVARFLMGVFGASVTPLALILIAHHIHGANRGKFVGIFFGASFAASLLGILLSGVISWRMIYLIPAAAGLLLWVYMYFRLPSFKSDEKEIKISYIPALRNRRIAGIFTYIFFVSVLYHGVQQWLGVYFSTAFGFNQFVVSMLVMLTSLSGVFGEVLGGRLADRIGRPLTVDLGIVFMAVSALVLIFKLPLAVIVLLMLVWGIGWTFNHVALSTILTDLPKEFLNESASLNSGVRFVAGGVGVALAGLLMQKSFVLGFVIFGVCLIGLFLFSQKLIKGVSYGK